MEKIYNSNLSQQKAVLHPALCLLKCYQVVIVGNREFHSVKLVNWLNSQQVYFALRQQKDTYVVSKNQDYQQLSQVDLSPRVKLFLPKANITNKKSLLN